MTKGIPIRFMKGQRFGSLVVLSVINGNRQVSRRVECLCDCGNIYLVVPYRLYHGEVERCFQCAPKRRTVEYIKFRRRLNNYENSAKRKGLSFPFNSEQFRKFYEAQCAYCGMQPAQGIDRKDNSLGYIESNCVPACAQCNYAKRHQLEKDFLSWVFRIAAHQGFSL